MRRFISYLYGLSLVRFVLTGVLNTLVGLGAIFALKWFFAMGDTTANLLGYGVGLVVSYVINSRWTFRYRESLLPVLPQYAAVVLLAYLANLACVHFCIRQLHLDSYLAQTAGVLPYSGLSYVLLRWYVFGRVARPAVSE
ncbi:MAG: GtrA family protein [Steroidobacteraceae bacterium]